MALLLAVTIAGIATCAAYGAWEHAWHGADPAARVAGSTDAVQASRR